MNRTKPRAAIIGCGIAGPVLGLFLTRSGVDATIYERRARGAAEEGAFLGVAPNGMNVLKHLGVHTAVEAVSVACDGFEFQNARGDVIGGIDRAADGTRFGARLQMIRRRDLHEVLTAAAIDQGVRVEFDRTLVAIDQSAPSRVTATFADGREAEAEVLVGCDGIHSKTRQLVLPASPQPEYTGLLDFGGFARCPDLPIAGGVNVMVFGRRAFFGAFKTPGGDVWWFHNGGAERPDAVPRDPALLRAHLLALHRADPSWIADVIGSTRDVLGPFPLHDILSLPRWHRGRVCLVGDAAHATTPSAGQGASLALEDAMALARCLRDIDEPSRAFAAFEQARRARVEAIVRQSRRTGSTKAVSGRFAGWMRDRLLPLFLRIGARAQERQYAYRMSWTDPAVN